MSTELDTAIYKRLTGAEDLSEFPSAAAAQVTLRAALGIDASTNAPAVYEGTWQNAIQLPAITFRASGGAKDRRFQTSGIGMADVYYDIEIWDGADRVNHTGVRPDGTPPNGDNIAPISDAVKILLDVTRGLAPLLPVTSGRVYQAEIFVELQRLYDKTAGGENNAGLMRWYFKEGRF